MLLLLSTLLACSDYDLKRGGDGSGGGEAADSAAPDGDTASPGADACGLSLPDVREVGATDVCEYAIGGFEPVEVWTAGSGLVSTASPAVADLDGDGVPEIIAAFYGPFELLTGSSADLYVLRGDTGAVVWNTSDDTFGYGTSPAVADVDGDGSPEIAMVREYANSLYGDGDYTVALYSAEGVQLWESDHFLGADFDYASAISISDMDHDGSPEIVAGRVILNADGSTRGVGDYGRGSYGIVNFGGLSISESSVSAVADIDLNGVEEVIVGNAYYGPDGNIVNADPAADDAMVGVANLDDDPEGEFIGITGNTVRAVDTDFSVIWGPVRLNSANIVSPPAIGDLDGDGRVEIVVAGGNELHCLDSEGNTIWRASVTDESGASGASIFDFEADGLPEVVYIDEVQMIAFDGASGEVRFQTDKHASPTMMEYPVIADIDADGHAEIVVSHAGLGYALSVYEDATDSWAPTRGVWNQHAYTITNINDDLSVPVEAEQGFATYNLWHGAESALGGEYLLDDLEGEIVDVCADCEGGMVYAAGWVINRSPTELPAGIPVALYGRWSDGDQLLATAETAAPIPPGWTGEPIEFSVDAELLSGAEALWIEVDDDGSGGGLIEECAESNNGFLWSGPFCE